MKGLAIYSIVILGILNLGFLYNIATGVSSGYQIADMILLAPVLGWAIWFVAKPR